MTERDVRDDDARGVGDDGGDAGGHGAGLPSSTRRGRGQFVLSGVVENDIGIRASRHAEEDALNALAKAIDSLGIAPESLHGYAVSLHISNAKGVCDTCFQGLGPSNVKAGVLRQFSERYPGLTIQVTAEDASARMGRPVITIRGGKILD